MALADAQVSALKMLGYDVASEYTPDCVIAAGVLDAEQAAELAPMLQAGARIVAACAAFENDHSEELLPEARRPVQERWTDWLYHRETVLRPGGRFLRGLQTGLADAHLYTEVITASHYESRGDQVPDETDAFAFETGCPCDRGYIGGFKLGLYRVGEGTLILNTFDLLDEAHRTPSAARMLVNLLDGI